MGCWCMGSRTSVRQPRSTAKRPPVPSARPSYGVERVLLQAQSGDIVSFIHMPGGTRREVAFISRTLAEGTEAGFTGRKRSGKVQYYRVEDCRDMFIPKAKPGLPARQMSIGESEGSDDAS